MKNSSNIQEKTQDISLEEQIFNKQQGKQMKFARKLLLGMFGGLGAVFFVLGILFLICQYYALFDIGIVYIILGLALVLIGLLMFWIFKHIGLNYQNYKKRTEKFGGVNLYQMQAKIIELADKVSKLESVINSEKNNN